MKNRRAFLLMLTAGVVALGVVVGPALAEEFFGTITKVDVEGKKLTVVSKEDKDVEVTVTDDTEFVTPKGANKINLAKIAKGVEKAKEKGKKGMAVIVTHEGGVASKIATPTKKKAE